MELKNEPQIKELTGLKEERFGGVSRRVFFSPETTGNNFLKMAYVSLAPGATGTPHYHLGEEIVYTISGHAVLTIEGREHHLTAGTCFLIPPDITHPAKAVGDEDWVAVAAFCDECPVLKEARGQQDRHYPVDA